MSPSRPWNVRSSTFVRGVDEYLLVCPAGATPRFKDLRPGLVAGARGLAGVCGRGGRRRRLGRRGRVGGGRLVVLAHLTPPARRRQPRGRVRGVGAGGPRVVVGPRVVRRRVARRAGGRR